MAIIKFATPIAGLRGSIGGIIYSANQAGPHARAYARGADPRSTKQDGQRATLAANARAWADMSDGDRADWDTWAALPAQEKTNPLGESYYCSGFQWFVCVQNWLATVGRNPTTTPPASARPIAPTITSLTIDVNGTPESNILYPAGEFGVGPPLRLSVEKTCGGGVTDGSGTDWLNPNNIAVADAANATVTLGTFGISSRLKARYHGSFIPATATVTGIKISTIYTTTTALTQATQLHKNEVMTGSIKTTAGTVEGSYRYWGGDGDLWGTTWTATQINTNAGSAFSLTAGAPGASATEDHEKMRVYYDPALPGPYDCIIEVFMATSPGKTTKTSGYRLLLATQSPGNITVEFQPELETLGGLPVAAAKYFARIYRQTTDGNRSPATTVTAIAA